LVYYLAGCRLNEIPLFRRFIRHLLAFPGQIESSDQRAALEDDSLLQAGQVVLIFPEGERSPDGRVQRFKPGAFRLAASLAAPVLPVTIAGGHDAWPPGRLLPRPRRITITYHRTLHPDPSLGPRQAAGDLARRAYAAVAS